MANMHVNNVQFTHIHTHTHTHTYTHTHIHTQTHFHPTAVLLTRTLINLPQSVVCSPIGPLFNKSGKKETDRKRRENV